MSEQMRRLVYLEASSRENGTTWTALDADGGEYGLGTHMGGLRLSGDMEHNFDHTGAPPQTRTEVLEILRRMFDLTLLERGDGCECGYSFEISEVPPHCPHCHARLLPLPVWSLKEAEPNTAPEALVKLAGAPRLYWSGCIDDGRALCILWSGPRVVAAIADSPVEEEFFEILANEAVDPPEGNAAFILERLERALIGAVDLAAVACGSCRSMRNGTGTRCDFCGRRTRTMDQRERLFGWLPTWYCVRVQWYRGGSELMRYDTLHGALQAKDFQFLDNSRDCRNAEYVGRRINWPELFFGWLIKEEGKAQ